MKKIKTNAARLLDREKVNYELTFYEVDETDLSAVHLAETINESIDRIFKTLVLEGDKTGHLVCIIPGGEELNLKKVAKVSNNKKVEMIPMKSLLPLTGYIRGACSPIGMKKHFPTYIDEACLNFDTIYVSAGQRGVQLKLNPKELIKVIKAEVCSLI
ncbi:MAG: Cys-tRNA(Pro) deacylase [Bacteroidales bacterium]|nr:Cys-tRNA(Pro) deacylase [Bacteroidales bacterium]